MRFPAYKDINIQRIFKYLALLVLIVAYSHDIGGKSLQTDSWLLNTWIQSLCFSDQRSSKDSEEYRQRELEPVILLALRALLQFVLVEVGPDRDLDAECGAHVRLVHPESRLEVEHLPSGA